MGRPPKYDWESIDADYCAGVSKDKIRTKYKVSRNTLDNRIRDKNLIVSGHAKAAIQGLGAVSEHLGALQSETPEIAGAVYDRISNETAFDINAGRIVAKVLSKLEAVVDKGTKLEKVGVGNGVQSFQEVGMMGGDYKEVLETVYKGKEIVKGKEAPVQMNNNVAVQNNITDTTWTVEVVDSINE